MTAVATEIEVTRQHDGEEVTNIFYGWFQTDRRAQPKFVRAHTLYSSLVFPLLHPSLVSRHCCVFGAIFFSLAILFSIYLLCLHYCAYIHFYVSDILFALFVD